MKKYIKAANQDSITFSSVLEALKNAGIDTTKSSYEMRAETYERYRESNLYTIKFTCPGDYLAYLAMYIHEPLTKANILNFIEEYFGNLDKMLKEIPSLPDMRNVASSFWWGDGSDYIIYLRNLTTGETLHEADYYPDEYEDEYEEDWDE